MAEIESRKLVGHGCVIHGSDITMKERFSKTQVPFNEPLVRETEEERKREGRHFRKIEMQHANDTRRTRVRATFAIPINDQRQDQTRRGGEGGGRNTRDTSIAELESS